MAVAAWTHTYTIKDGKGKKGTVTLSSNHGTNALALSAHNDMRGYIADMITGVIVEAKLSQTTFTSAATPATSSDIEEKGQFSWVDADTYVMLTSIPTFDESFVLVGTSNIDTSNPTIGTFVSAMTGDGFTNARAIDIVSLSKAVEKFG